MKKIYNIGKYTYIVQEIKGGYSIIENDYSMLETLKQKRNEKNKELKKQEEILLKSKEMKEKLYRIEVKASVLKELETRIEEKKKIIETKIKMLEPNDKESLEKIKLYIGYSKRISTLVIDNYNDEIYNEEKLKVILDELLSDMAMFNVNGVVVIGKMNIKVSIAYNIYSIIFELIEKLRDINMLIYIYETEEGIELKFAMNKLCEKLVENIAKEKIIKVEERKTEDGTDINILIQC